MNKRQKSLILNIILVLAITTAFIVLMMNVKDLLNKKEAMRAMGIVGQELLNYREHYGSLPPESFLANIKEQFVRLGTLNYRAQWIGFDSEPNTILAYTYKNYHSLAARRGYVVLRLDGRIEWIGKKQFEELLRKQQTSSEIEILQEEL
jgi:hypothetical protein